MAKSPEGCLSCSSCGECDVLLPRCMNSIVYNLLKSFRNYPMKGKTRSFPTYLNQRCSHLGDGSVGQIGWVLETVDGAVQILGHLDEREGAALDGRRQEERRLSARLLKDSHTGVGNERERKPRLWGHLRLL